MAKRSKFSKKKSRKDFSRKASRVHRKNGLPDGASQRGGIRL